MRAMILAAGLGTRLRPITYEMPKPMVPILGRPVMDHIARLLARHGFTEVVANLHWFPDLIRSYFGDGSEVGLELSYSYEEQLLGTAGGVRNAAGFLGETFLIISGDALTDINLGEMRAFHESHDGIATIAARRVSDTSEFGVMITDEEVRIQGFQEKPDPAEALSDLANSGIYMFDAEIFDYFPGPGERSALAGPDDPEGFADWAMDVFPAMLAADVPFYAHEVDGYWNDIGNLQELHAGNMDALRGDVVIEPGAPEISPGIFAADPAAIAGVELTGSAFVGAGTEIGSGVRIEGLAVIAGGCRIGDGSRIRDAVLLEGTALEPGSVVAGGILGRREPGTDS